MTEAPLNHPDDEALRALSLGQLPEAELVHVSAHLSDCPACCRRIDQLATDDHLLARLQEGAANRENVLVNRVQRRLAVRALRQPSDPQSPSPTQVGDYNLLADVAGNPGEHEELARHRLRGDLPAGFGNPTVPHSSMGDMKPVLLRKAKGESDPVEWPGSDAMSQKGDRYQLFGEIARGGMGAVLRARDSDLGRNLAVKVLLEKYARQPDVARRFVEEAQIGGQLQHPNVVPVYDIGRFGDRPFFTMKLVEGKTLAAILDERQQPTEDRPRLLNIALQVAQAMAYAHAKGVIHRDLKPTNIMVGEFGEVQVMDWGLAKVLNDGRSVADEEPASRGCKPPEEGKQIRTVRSNDSTKKIRAETWVESLSRDAGRL